MKWSGMFVCNLSGIRSAFSLAVLAYCALTLSVAVAFAADEGKKKEEKAEKPAAAAAATETSEKASEKAEEKVEVKADKKVQDKAVADKVAADKAAAHDHKADEKAQAEGEKPKLHAAHKHGEAQVSVAVDQGKVMLNVEFTQESLVGFEYAPKTDAEKKALADAQKKVTSASLLAWEKDLGCKESSSDVKVVYEGEHAEVKFHGEYACTGLGKGKKLTFKLKEVFPKVAKVHVEFVPAEGKASKQVFETATFDLAL